VLSLVGERFRLVPGAAQDLDVLVGPLVALGLGQVVAFAVLLAVVAAGYDVDRQAPALIWSSVANVRAALVGNTTPGRWASIGLIRPVFAATNWASWFESTQDEW